MTKLSIDAIAVSLHAARAAAPSTNRDALGTEGQLYVEATSAPSNQRW
jgi:hypothetical protein